MNLQINIQKLSLNLVISSYLLFITSYLLWTCSYFWRRRHKKYTYRWTNFLPHFGKNVPIFFPSWRIYTSVTWWIRWNYIWNCLCDLKHQLNLAEIRRADLGGFQLQITDLCLGWFEYLELNLKKHLMRSPWSKASLNSPLRSWVEFKLAVDPRDRVKCFPNSKHINWHNLVMRQC